MRRTNFTSYEAHRPSILLVREDAVLPPALATKGQSAFLPGWRAIKNFDEYTLRRKLRETAERYERKYESAAAAILPARN